MPVTAQKKSTLPTTNFFDNLHGITGFNALMRNKVLDTIRRIAKSRPYFSNTTYSIIYKLIKEDKVAIFFTPKIRISKFFVSDNPVEVVGSYELERNRIEIFVKWSFGADLVSDMSSAHMPNICMKIFAIILSEALLLYNKRSGGALATHATVRDWYNSYFSSLFEQITRQPSISSNLASLVSKDYGPTIYNRIESAIMSGRSPSVRIDTKGNNPELDIEGIPSIVKGPKVLEKIFEDVILDPLLDNLSSLGVNAKSQLFQQFKKLSEDFGQFGSFLYKNSDLPLIPENLEAFPDTDKETAVSYDARKNMEKRLRNQQKSDDIDFVRNRSESSRDIAKIERKQKALDYNTKQKELYLKSKSSDNKFYELESDETYIKKYMINANHLPSLNDLDDAIAGTKESLLRLKELSDTVTNDIQNAKSEEEKEKIINTFKAQRIRAKNLYDDLYKLFQMVTNNTTSSQLFQAPNSPDPNKPDYTKVESMMNTMQSLVNRQRSIVKYDDSINSSASKNKEQALRINASISHSAQVLTNIQREQKALTTTGTLLVNKNPKDYAREKAKAYNDLYDKLKSSQTSIIANKNELLKQQRALYVSSIFAPIQTQEDSAKISSYISDRTSATNRLPLVKSNPNKQSYLDYGKIENGTYSEEFDNLFNMIDFASSVKSKTDNVPLMKKYISNNQALNNIKASLDRDSTLLDKEALRQRFEAYYKDLQNTYLFDRNMPMQEKRARIKRRIESFINNEKLKIGNAYRNSKNLSMIYNRKLFADRFGTEEQKRNERSINPKVIDRFIKQKLKDAGINTSNMKEISDRLSKIGNITDTINTLQQKKGINVNIDAIEALKPGQIPTDEQIKNLLAVASNNLANELKAGSSDRVIHVDERDLPIPKRQKLYYLRGFGLWLGNQLENAPTITNIIGNYIKSGKAKQDLTSLWHATKDAYDYAKVILPSSGRITTILDNSKFGFGDLADIALFDLAYKDASGIKKMYTLHKGTISAVMVYNEIFMPTSILQKILYAKLTKESDYNALVLELIQHANKGLESLL